MKIVKIFGVVMAVHAAVFMFVFAIPGCRSTSKKPAAAATAVGGSDVSPLAASDTMSPVAAAPASSSETAAVRFSPTRPGTPAAAEVTAPPPPVTYTVVKGDNLWIIAKKNGVTVKQLTAANNLRTDSTLKLGQKLVIPGKAAESAPAVSTLAAPAAVAAPAAAHATTTTVIHVIKAGETLGTIAKKYSVKVGDIAAANNIADPTKIRVGQSLKIPTKSAPAAKPAATVKAAPAVSTPAPAPAVAPVAPAPIFTSPLLESAPATSSGSPLITPAPESTDAPVIRVEESNAPKIE